MFLRFKKFSLNLVHKFMYMRVCVCVCIYIYTYIYILYYTIYIHTIYIYIYTIYIYIYMYILVLLHWWCILYVFIWTHGKEELSLCLEDLNNFYPNIKFSMKLALSESWIHGLIAQLVRASERNSVVVGSNPTQANFP